MGQKAGLKRDSFASAEYPYFPKSGAMVTAGDHAVPKAASNIKIRTFPSIDETLVAREGTSGTHAPWRAVCSELLNAYRNTTKTLNSSIHDGAPTDRATDQLPVNVAFRGSNF